MSASDRRRVLLVHRYFDPDMTTYAQMLAIFADHLGAAGHDVTVLCGPANYNGVYSGPKPPRSEQRPNYRVLRVRLPGATGRLSKLFGFACFPVAVVLHSVRQRRRYHVVSVTTMPPIVMGVAGWLSTRRSGSRFVYHCMDLYPELLGPQLSAVRRLASRIALRVDLGSMRHAEQVIVLSGDMKDTIAARSAAPVDAAVSNNFIIESHDRPFATRSGDGPCRFIFAGNLGRFQGIERLIEAFGKIDGDAELLFLGAGPMVQTIKEAASRDLRILHRPHVPLPEAMREIEQNDVAVVSLEPGVISTAFPSKVLMYLELGRRILAVVEPESELARMVDNERLGSVADPGDIEMITAAMQTLLDCNGFLEANAIQTVARSRFSRETVLQRWASLYGLGPA